MTTALERLAALTGKDRVVIVSSSALVEWERTELFKVHTGREGTEQLAEIVLSHTTDTTGTQLAHAASTVA